MQVKNKREWTALDELADDIRFEQDNQGTESRALPTSPVARRVRVILALDMRPLTTLNCTEINAARTKAKERWARMSPEEQALWTKVAAEKRQPELTAL